jgi:hypothetical protein
MVRSVQGTLGHGGNTRKRKTLIRVGGKAWRKSYFSHALPSPQKASPSSTNRPFSAKSFSKHENFQFCLFPQNKSLPKKKKKKQ